MAAEEQILVIERKILEELGMFNGLMFDVGRYREKIFEPGVTKYMLRSQAEENPDFKQLIPYVVMSCEGKILSYVRGKRAGETRLVGNRSIGIGGHINPVDDMSLFSPFDSYLNAVVREVDEEVDVKAKYTNNIIALLNDESNEVGKVHLGIVHHWALDAPKVDRKEQMITQLGFMDVEELQAVRDTLETWSSLALDYFAKLNG